MKQLFLYVLFGLSSASLNASDNARVSALQTFLTLHATPVTEREPVRLKEIDIANPLFLFR